MGWSFWVNIAMLLFLGILGASSIIIKKKPEAKDLIDKMAKISGYVGAIAVLWGIWDAIDLVRTMGMISLAPLIWFTALAHTLVFLGLGFIFGYGLINTYAIAKMSDDAKAKAEGMRAKLVGLQIPLGLLAIGLAVWWLVLVYVIY
jgi:hypothetical protein